MSDNRKILVTGTQRAGTTWIGNILSATSDVGYIHEPYNTTNVKIHRSPITIPYQYINEKLNEEAQGVYKKYLEYFLDPGFKFFFNSLGPYRNIDSRYILPARQHISSGWNKKTKIIKDPFALLSCEWLHGQLGWDIVIIVRHPAAFVLSMVEKSWTIAPTVFERQREDLQHIYADHEDLIDSYITKPNKKDDLVGCAIYGWKLMHIAIDYYRKNYKNWIILRHEDISMDPYTITKQLYDNLRLTMTPAVEKILLNSTSGNSVIGNNRDPKQNLEKWKHKLDANTIERIREETLPISDRFYSAADW